MNICIVDDDRAFLDALDEVLSSEGHAVRVAPDGCAAERILADWQPDIVLCDLLMPTCEGFEFLRKVRRQHPDLKFVMMSGARGPLSQLLTQASDLGADATIAKPFMPNELFSLIADLVPGQVASGNGN
jgi:DNA-binding response OmpR family regulator